MRVISSSPFCLPPALLPEVTLDIWEVFGGLLGGGHIVLDKEDTPRSKVRAIM